MLSPSRSLLGLSVLPLLALAPGCATLHEQARRGDTSAVARHVADGADIGVRNRDGHTPLHLAVLHRHRPVVTALLEGGADADARGPRGATPLHYWALGRHRDGGLAEELLAAGASVRAQADDGSTPLHWAAGREIRRSASSASRSPTRELAVEVERVGRVPVVGPIAGLGVATVVGLLAPLEILAAIFGTSGPEPVENVMVLLAAGADPLARDDNGGTPLHWAATASASPRVVTTLLSAGADARARDDDGNTPLHWAADANASLEVVRALLSAGANAAAENAAGTVPADLVAADSVLRPLLAEYEAASLSDVPVVADLSAAAVPPPARADTEPGEVAAANTPTPALPARVDSQGRPIYRMRMTIHGVDDCGDESGSPEYYSRVDREDPEAWALVNATAREAEVVSRGSSVWAAWEVLDSLQRRDTTSRIEPLSEAEQRSLARLRQTLRELEQTPFGRLQEGGLPYDRAEAEARVLAPREALSPAEERRMRLLQPLQVQWRTQLQQVRMQEGASRLSQYYRSYLDVYPNDVLQISLREWDTFDDDDCFDTTAVLGPEALESGLLEIRHFDQVALTLHFSR